MNRATGYWSESGHANGRRRLSTDIKIESHALEEFGLSLLPAARFTKELH